MLAPAPHLREEQRLALVRSLERYGIEPEPQLEELTRALAIALDAPIAMIDATDIWFLTCIGLPVRNGPREQSVCGHTILLCVCYHAPRHFPDSELEALRRSGPSRTAVEAGAEPDPCSAEAVRG